MREEEQGTGGRGMLHTTLLLDLPPDLEKAFWKDDSTIRTYTKSDFFTAGHAILGIMLTARTLSAALTNPAILRDTWFIFLVLAVNLSSCLGTLLLIHCFPAIYHARRHEFTIANRLLRLGGVVLQGVCRTTPASQAAVGSSMSRQPGGGLQGDNRSVAQVALLNLTRPLYFSPVILLGHGNWYFGAKSFLLLQVLTQIAACHGATRYQPCRLARDPYASAIVQATCQKTSHVHEDVVSLVTSLFAPHLSALLTSGLDNTAATCSTLLGSARVLSYYSHAAYILLMPGATQLYIEWKLKSRWVHKLGKQLAYGPLGWPRSQLGVRPQRPAGSGWLYRLQQAYYWLLGVSLALALLWLVCLWVVPKLPMERCPTCEDSGTCQPLAPCEGWLCAEPGFWAALVLYAEMASCCVIYYFIMMYMTDLL